MNAQLFEGLAKFFAKLLSNSDFDAIIKVGEEPNTKLFRVHVNIGDTFAVFFYCVLKPSA